jgi:predicted RNA-binding protein
MWQVERSKSHAAFEPLFHSMEEYPERERLQQNNFPERVRGKAAVKRVRRKFF